MKSANPFLLLIVMTSKCSLGGQGKNRRQLLNSTTSCDRFPDYCPTECTSIDSVGCLACNCKGVNSTETSKPINSSGNQAYPFAPSTDVGQNGGSGSSSSAGHNMVGCPKLAKNCKFDCLSIGKNGCIICTCTKEGSSTSLTGGASLTSSGTDSQLGQRPGVGGVNNSLPLTNVNSPFSINTGSAGTGSSGTSGASAHASQNSNGCPAFPNNCQASCASLDKNGCPICACTKNSTSSSSGNNNGCPPFPVNCRSDCVSLNSFGCPLCSCTSGSGSTSISNNTTFSGASGKQSSSQASSNNNGCPAFPTNCRTDCVELTSLGCPLCTCTTSGSGESVTGSSSSSSSVSGYNQASQGSVSNNNGCPKFSSNCPAQCTTTNDRGCPVCTCSASNQLLSTSGTDSSSSAAGGSHVECPPLKPHCQIACLTTDNKGCIICNGDCNENFKKQHNGTSIVTTTTKPVTSIPSTSSGVTGGNGGNVNCAPFDHSCSASCATFDLHGCLICTCTDNNGGNSGTPSGNINGCLPFDTNCPGGCAAVDKNGCLTCTCSVIGNNNTTGSGIANGTSGGSGNSGTITCPAFDGAHCNPTCIGLDENGCLSCDCKADVTTPLSVVSTPTALQGNGITRGPTNSGKNGGTMTTVSPVVNGAGSSTGTQNGNIGTGNTNSCAAYDTKCQPGCTKLDAFGCLSCSCSQNNTSGLTSGSTGNGNNCPAFNTKCTADCTHIDAMGCLTCSCSGKTTPAGVETGSHGSNGNANNCPAVDIMSCEPTCLKLDNNGCVLCTCEATTTNAMTSSPTISTVPTNTATTTAMPLTTLLQTTQSTTVPNQSCPKFDESCPHDCIIIDTRGCLGCTCSASSQSPITERTRTSSPVTSKPTSQVTMTNSLMTQTTQASQQTTPGVCPEIRCIYPCNAGVTLGVDNCPVCKCRTDVTSSKPSV